MGDIRRKIALGIMHIPTPHYSNPPWYSFTTKLNFSDPARMTRFSIKMTALSGNIWNPPCDQFPYGISRELARINIGAELTPEGPASSNSLIAGSYATTEVGTPEQQLLLKDKRFFDKQKNGHTEQCIRRPIACEAHWRFSAVILSPEYAADRTYKLY